MSTIISNHRANLKQSLCGSRQYIKSYYSRSLLISTCYGNCDLHTKITHTQTHVASTTVLEKNKNWHFIVKLVEYILKIREKHFQKCYAMAIMPKGSNTIIFASNIHSVWIFILSTKNTCVHSVKKSVINIETFYCIGVFLET